MVKNMSMVNLKIYVQLTEFLFVFLILTLPIKMVLLKEKIVPWTTSFALY